VGGKFQDEDGHALINAPHDWSLSVMLRDLNGDGLSFADQFTGNPDRFPGLRRNSGRLDWSTTIDVGASYKIPAPHGAVELRGDVFNLFDAETQSGYPVNFTVSNQRQVFGRAFTQNSAGSPRTFQVTARYSF
jgi:hypothetical protein